MTVYTKSEVMNYVHEYEQLVNDTIDRLKLAAQCGAINPPPGADAKSYLAGMVDGLIATLREIEPVYRMVTTRIPT